MPRKKKERLKVRKDGRYKCKWHGIQFYGSTPEEAFAARDEYIQNQEKGFKRQTVSDYALPWLRRSFPEVADSTYTGLAIHMQHLIDEIGDKQIANIVPSDIKDIYSNQYKGCSTSYLKSAKQLFSSLFDSAVADGLIHFNPAGTRPQSRKRGANQKPDRSRIRNESGF